MAAKMIVNFLHLSRKFALPLLAALGLILFMAWSGGFFHGRIAPGKEAFEAGKPLPEKARLYRVREESIAPRIDVVGTTESEEKIHLSARISAYVKSVSVSAGEEVKSNQILVLLDDREITEELAAAQARLKQTEREYRRTQQLFQNQASTDQALTTAESAYVSSKAKVDRIKVMLTYTRISSPIDGIVTDRRIEAGDLANPGQVLLTVYDPRNIRLVAPVPVRLVERLQPGREAEVELNRSALRLKGRVSEIVSEIDPQSRTQKVKIHLYQNDLKILPGTFGRLWIEDDPRPALLVPAASVRRVGQLEFVEAVVKGRVLRRLVKTGMRQGERLEILSGLKQGDQILMGEWPVD